VGSGDGEGDGDVPLASETVVAFVGIAVELRFPASELIGFIEADGLTVGNVDMSAICAKLVDVTALMAGPDVVGCDVGVAMVVGTLATPAGELDPTGVGFIMTGVGFIMTGVGFMITGIGFITTGVGLMMTGIGLDMAGAGFIMGDMAVIPDPMESRALPSSISTEIDAFRRVLREVIPGRSCS
jgi:hypothetical protein